MDLKKKGILFMWIAVILWGISFVGTKVVVEYIPPLTAGFFRFLLAAIALMLFFRKDIKYTKKEFFILSLTAFFGITAYFLFENSALQYTTATNSSLIISTTPMIYLIINDIIKKSFSHKIRYLGTFIALIGVSILVLNGRFVLKLNPLGDTLMIGAVISWVLYTLFLEKLEHLNSNTVTRDMNILGSIFFIPLVFLELKSSNTCPIFSLWLQPKIIIALIYLGVFSSALAYILWNQAIRFAGSRTVTNGIYFIPLVTVIADSIILKNYPNIYAITGIILVLGGTFVAELKQRASY